MLRKETSVKGSMRFMNTVPSQAVLPARPPKHLNVPLQSAVVASATPLGPHTLTSQFPCSLGSKRPRVRGRMKETLSWKHRREVQCRRAQEPAGRAL